MLHATRLGPKAINRVVQNNSMCNLIPSSPSTLNVARQTSVGLNGGLGSPARSVFDPYDTTSLHIFIREAFPGAVLLEEHQVDRKKIKLFPVAKNSITIIVFFFPPREL